MAMVCHHAFPDLAKHILGPVPGGKTRGQTKSLIRVEFAFGFSGVRQ